MMSNLNAEMARARISRNKIANILGVSEKTVRNKLNGNTAFSINEALLIKQQLFPSFDTDYLFASDELQFVG